MSQNLRNTEEKEGGVGLKLGPAMGRVERRMEVGRERERGMKKGQMEGDEEERKGNRRK